MRVRVRVEEEGDRTALTAYGPTQRRCKRSNENLEEGDAAAAAAARNRNYRMGRAKSHLLSEKFPRGERERECDLGTCG